MNMVGLEIFGQLKNGAPVNYTIKIFWLWTVAEHEKKTCVYQNKVKKFKLQTCFFSFFI